MKKMNAEEKAAYREKKRDEAETYKVKLVDGVESLRNSDSFREYLDIMSRFPNYSTRNMMMIFTQKPEATLVQGFAAWKKCGRTVNKGEKSAEDIRAIGV